MRIVGGILVITLGVVWLIASSGIASVFTSQQQQDRRHAHPDAGWYQRINTVGVGLFIVGAGFFVIFR